MGCLYKLTSPSGKSYIGITIHTAAYRWRNHLKDVARGSSLILHRAIRKYGYKHFVVETLALSDCVARLERFEIAAISAFNTLNPFGYNMNGGGRFPVCLSEAVKESMKSAATQRFAKASERSAASERMKRLWKDPEYRAAMVAKLKERCSSEAFRSHARNNIKRQRENSDFKLKHSKATSRRMNALWSDPKYANAQLTALHARSSRDKARVGLLKAWQKKPKTLRVGTRTGCTNSPEQNAAIGKANKRRYADPALRSLLSERTRKAWSDPNHRAMRIAAIRKYHENQTQI